jgi:hypothetical protein
MQPAEQRSRNAGANELSQDESRDEAEAMPAKVSDRLRARVTAGLAKDVDAVNQ